MTNSMWEILVPTERRMSPEARERILTLGNPEAKLYYSTRYHKVWDQKVREVTGGLTIMTPAKGQWVSPCGELFIERMIPVRIVATREQIELIIDMTMSYYDQLAILCYKISDEVILRHRGSHA